MEVRAPIGSYLTPSFEHARVRDAMRPQVLACDPATPLVTVAQRMAGEHVHAVVVLRPGGDAGTGGRPWGVLTDGDLLRGADRVEELTAADVATGEVLEAEPDDRIADLARRMLDHGVSHALVVDPVVGRPVGVVSTLDMAGILGWGRG